MIDHDMLLTLRTLAERQSFSLARDMIVDNIATSEHPQDLRFWELQLAFAYFLDDDPKARYEDCIVQSRRLSEERHTDAEILFWCGYMLTIYGPSQTEALNLVNSALVVDPFFAHANFFMGTTKSVRTGGLG